MKDNFWNIIKQGESDTLEALLRLRMLRDAVKEYPTMMFEFRNAPQGFVTEFSYEEQKTNLLNSDFTDNMKKIIRLIRKNSTISQSEIASKLGISKQ